MNKNILIHSFLLIIILCTATTFSAEMSSKATVAIVGKGSISLDKIMEVWGPIWYEVTGKARSGKIADNNVDPQLQKEWEKALDTVIRDEMFYQEAQNDFSNRLRQMVNQQYAVQRSSGTSRQQVEARLKHVINKVRQRQIRSMVEHNVKSAGGDENLTRILKSRGITYEEWKNRVVRKAYTYSYLYSIFEPMGKMIQPSPREVLRYYKAHPDEFTEPGNVTFKHIFFDNKKHGGENGSYDAASRVYAAIESGKLTFSDAATKYSDDKISSVKGGLENSLSPDPEREAWLSEVRNAAKDQVPGKLGPVLISPRGCHLAMLINAERGRLIPYRQAQKSILSQIDNKKWEKKAEDFYNKLKNKIMVQIKMPTFPPKYSWNSAASRRQPRRIGFGASPLSSK